MDVLELISASLDGVLSPDQEKQLQTWLDQHPEDRTLYQELAQTSAALKDLPPAEVPPQLTERIMAALPQKKPIPWGRWVAAAAVISLVLAGGYLSTWRMGSSGDAQSAPAAAEAPMPAEGGEEVALFSVQGSTPQVEEEAVMDTFQAAAERKAVSPAAAAQTPPQEVWDSVQEGLDPAGQLVLDGLSPNGRYWLFLWTLEGDTTRCAASLDGSQVVWEEESQDFQALIDG